MARCRFEATDLNMDEIALMKLTGTLLDSLRHPMAVLLTDAQVCGAIETTFRLCFQTRFSEMMRQASCFSAVNMVQLVFSHLPRLVREADAAGTDASVVVVRLKPIALPFAKVVDGPDTPAMANLDETVVIKSPPPAPTPSPFGIACLAEILLFLSKLLDGGRLDDRGRCLAADALGVIVESTREQLETVPRLFRIMSNDVCRNLIALVSINTAPLVLRQLIHPLGALFRLYRRRFVSQFGFFMERLIEALKSKPSSNPRMLTRFIETRTVLLELALEFLEDDDLIVDLYVHYECDIRYPMLLTELIACLTELANVFDNKAGGSESTALLAMQMLNRMLFELAVHAKGFKMAGGISGSPTPSHCSADFSESRRLKQIMQEAASLYNKKPKEAFAFLHRQGLLEEPAGSEEVARFLRRTPGLDKRTMGEYLAKEGNEVILLAYLSDFDFQPGETIDMALRKVLESFRLPGEAQQIDRVVEAFAAVYYRSVGCKAAFGSQDATHVLAFSIIMLNTDLYNPQNQKRMTIDEFLRNNRGINEGADFDPDLLRHIYREISEREIVLPEEVQSAEYVWRMVLSRADAYAQGLDGMPELAPTPPVPHLGSVLGLLFSPLLACYLTEGLRPEELSKLSFAGIDLLSRVLGDLELHPLIAELIEALWQATGIPAQLSSQPNGGNGGPGSPRPSVSQPGSPIPPPPSATRARVVRHVARSEACHRTLKTLFAIVQSSGPSLRAGWRTVCTALFAFADAGLLNLEMVDPELRNEIKLATNLDVKPGTPYEASLAGSNGASGVPTGGILSAFSSYIVSSAPDSGSQGAEQPQEPVDPAAKDRALQVLREACQLDRILQETRYFEADSLHALLQALSQGLLFSAGGPVSEHSLVIVLELLVYVAWQNRDRLAMFWPMLSSCLADLSKLPRRRLCEHAVMGLGRICLWLTERPAASQAELDVDALEGPPPLFLQVLCHVAPDTFEYIAAPAALLALRIAEAARSGAGLSATLWPHYFTLLSRASRLRACDDSTYGLLAILIPQQPEDPLLLPLDFFSEYLDLLSSFIANSVEVRPGSEVTHLSLASKDSLRSPTEAASTVASATRALEGLFELQSRLKHYDWSTYILPLHLEVAKLCAHPSRVLRQHCLYLLQRLVLSLDYAQSASSRAVLPSLFEEVLLPLLAVKPASPGADQRLMEVSDETQMQVASILTKALLRHVPILLEEGHVAFLAFWSRILQSLLDVMQGRSDILRESVPESIKNMLLVMDTAGPLSASSEAHVREFWVTTWSLLDPINPRLHQEFNAHRASHQPVEERRPSVSESMAALAVADKGAEETGKDVADDEDCHEDVNEEGSDAREEVASTQDEEVISAPTLDGTDAIPIEDAASTQEEEDNEAASTQEASEPEPEHLQEEEAVQPDDEDTRPTTLFEV